jgi:hypothetical protein
MLQVLKAVRPVYEAFYDKLDSAQKLRLDALGPRPTDDDGRRTLLERAGSELMVVAGSVAVHAVFGSTCITSIPLRASSSG